MTQPNHCQRCNTWHPEPPCDHNCEAKCVRCGLPVGYLWVSDDPIPPGACWYCVAATAALGTGDLATKEGTERRGDARFLVRGVIPMVLDSVRREGAGVEGRLRVGTAETTVKLGPNGYSGRIEVEGYRMVVVIDPKDWGVKFLN